jgi:hypothetical protein
MPADIRNPRTLILEGEPLCPVEAVRLPHSKSILIHITNHKIIELDEETAAHLSDALNGLLTGVYDRAISRSIHDIERSTPRLEDL